MEENTDEPKAIHTYQTDVEEAIKRENISKAKIFVADQKQERVQPPPPLNPSGTSLSFNIRSLVFGLLFLLIGVGVIYYFVRTPPEKIIPEPVIATTPEQSIISYDSYELWPLEGRDKATLTNWINENKTKFTSPEVRVYSFGVEAEQFVGVLMPGMTGIFSRSLNPQFSFGLVGGNNVTDLARSFLILKVNEYSAARGTLFSAEGNIRRELGSAFDIPTDVNLYFRDLVIENKDIRALVDQNNRVYLLYSFIDSGTLVFAEDDDTFKIIIDRINAAKR